jgi:hypothetical protein
MIFISGELDEMWWEILESRDLNLNVTTKLFEFEHMNHVIWI